METSYINIVMLWLPMVAKDCYFTFHFILKFTGTKTGETHLETAILDGDTHFFFFFKSLFGCFTLSVEAFKLFTPKGCILVQ